jgi:hypothetical protein
MEYMNAVWKNKKSFVIRLFLGIYRDCHVLKDL